MLVRTNEMTDNLYAIYAYEGDRATNVTDIAVYKRQVLLEEQYGVKLKLLIEVDNAYSM